MLIERLGKGISMPTANKIQRVRKAGCRVADYRAEATPFAATIFLVWVVQSRPFWVSVPLFAVLIGVGIWQRKKILPRTHELLEGSKVRRQLKRAARDSGFGELSVEKIIMTLPGEWAHVSVPRGATVDSLERASRAMAGCLKVADVRVIPDRKNRSRASVSIIRRDPFDHMDGYVWPTLHAERTNVREHMPAGFDEYGRLVKARLLSRNLIVAGAPDSGKSSFLRLPAAYTALDPNARMWLMDGKSVEFEAWKTCAHAFVSGPDLKGAVEMLTLLRDEMEARYQRIRAAGEVFILDDMEVDVLMIDEVPTYLRPTVMTDKKAMEQIKTIQGLLWTIVARGRAAGVITILSAQKPDANTIPTDIRDLFDNKLALHCNTKAMSDTILGQGAGQESVANAAEIPSGQPGVGYYVGDDGVRKIKSFFISHQQAIEVASRVASRQLDEELSTLNA
jgi:S-DNA-T family DNA segregation ATPase FtsK/SpoIIIE